MPYLPDLTSLLPGKASTTTTASEASPAGPSHTPFRLAEKHFKNRFNPLKLPSLRNRPVPVLDLSRPARQEDDEVWKAGWWSPENEPGSRPRRGKGKARELGERPAQDFEGLERNELNDGRTGWIVAEGVCSSSRVSRTLADDRLCSHTWLPQRRRSAQPSQGCIGGVHSTAQPVVPLNALCPAAEPVQDVRGRLERAGASTSRDPDGLVY